MIEIEFVQMKGNYGTKLKYWGKSEGNYFKNHLSKSKETYVMHPY